MTTGVHASRRPSALRPGRRPSGLHTEGFDQERKPRPPRLRFWRAAGQTTGADPRLSARGRVRRASQNALAGANLLDDGDEPIVVVGRFLDHLAERACSPHTLCAYGYDLQQLFTFLAGEQLVWQAFEPAA